MTRIGLALVMVDHIGIWASGLIMAMGTGVGKLAVLSRSFEK
jgi:hypothetical protein